MELHNCSQYIMIYLLMVISTFYFLGRSSDLKYVGGYVLGHSFSGVQGTVYLLGHLSLSDCFLLYWTGLNWFKAIYKIHCIVHSISAHNCKEEIKSIKAKSQVFLLTPKNNVTSIIPSNDCWYIFSSFFLLSNLK